jgi:hypothetical protein
MGHADLGSVGKGQRDADGAGARILSDGIDFSPEITARFGSQGKKLFLVY